MEDVECKSLKKSKPASQRLTRKYLEKNRKLVCIFEVEGGTDKGPDGHRKDTIALLLSLRSLGYKAEVKFFTEDSQDALVEYMRSSENSAYIARINPTPTLNMTVIDAFFEKLTSLGIYGFTNPQVVKKIGTKQAMYKLRDLEVGCKDTR